MRSAVLPTDAATRLGQSFRGMTAALRRMKGRETHRPGRLSYAQYELLFRLADGSARSARELAHDAELSAATVAEMLDHLDAIGLLMRVRSEHDKRVVLTSLTDRGHLVVKARKAQIEPYWQAALSEFTEEELDATARVLDRLRVMFDELPALES